MSIEKIPPFVRQTSGVYPTQNTGTSAPIDKTSQAAKPVLKNSFALEDRPFANTATLKEDLGPLTRRIAELASGTHFMTSGEVKEQIARCEKGLQDLQGKLNTIKFDVEFPIMNELNPRQPGSFASNVLRNAKRILEGGKSDVRHAK